MNQATMRIVFWVLGLSFLLAAATCPAEAQETVPPTVDLSVDPSGLGRPLVCVNGWVSDNQARYIEHSAHVLGMRTVRAKKYQRIIGCSVYFIRGDADTWLRGKYRTYTFKGISKSKALKVLQDWTYQQTITAQCCVNESCVDC